MERTVVRPSRSYALAPAPAGVPVISAALPEGTPSGWIVTPATDVLAGLPRTHRPEAGAVSVPSGFTVQPRGTSRSSSNAPHRALRTAAPRTPSGHHACSTRYSTASLLRLVSEAISVSLGRARIDISNVYAKIRYTPYS